MSVTNIAGNRFAYAPSKIGGSMKLKPKYFFEIIFLSLSLSQFSIANSDNSALISAGSSAMGAVLGSAYKSDQQRFAGDRCVDAATYTTLTGQAQGGFTFDSSISEEQLSSELGFGIGGRAQYGAAEYSAAASFMKQSMSDSLSVSAVWESSYSFPSNHLINPSLSAIGQSVRNNDERWAKTCGDQYVAEITYGAKLFFSIRIEFKNQNEKNDFQAKFSVSGPLYSADGELKTASSSFNKHTKITISAYQIGGDISKLTSLFDTTEAGQQQFVECELGGYETCAKVVVKALQYAADVRSGFPSQLAPGVQPGPAVLSYYVIPYSAIGIYPNSYPHIDQATILARQKLSDEFSNQYRLQLLADRLIAQSHLGSRQIPISNERVKISHNISKILAVSKICYDTPQDCWDAEENHLAIETINTSIFEPESFLSLCKQARAADARDSLRLALTSLQDAIGSNDSLDCRDLYSKVQSATVVELVSNPMYPISDLRLLQTLTNLTKLTIKNARVTDITPLADLTNLRQLDLSGNRIVDLRPISDLQDLVNLNLTSNRINNLKPISGMFHLQWLQLAQNLISGLNDLTYYPQMISVDLRSNPLSSAEIENFRQRLPTNTIIAQ